MHQRTPRGCVPFCPSSQWRGQKRRRTQWAPRRWFHPNTSRWSYIPWLCSAKTADKEGIHSANQSRSGSCSHNHSSSKEPLMSRVTAQWPAATLLLMHLDQVARCRNMTRKVEQIHKDTQQTRWWLFPTEDTCELLDSAREDQNRVMCTPTSTTDINVVARGGIVVALVETFRGSSSLRLVLY